MDLTLRIVSHEIPVRLHVAYFVHKIEYDKTQNNISNLYFVL